MTAPARNRVTIVCGNAGVGKTTWGRKLAQEERALLIDIDTVSEALVMAGLKAAGQNPLDRDSPIFKQTYREAIHSTLFAIADENLDTLPCILVAPFTQERRQSTFAKELHSLFKTDVRVHYLICNDEVRFARIKERGNPRDQGKLDDWESYRLSGRDLGPPPFEHILVDTSF